MCNDTQASAKITKVVSISADLIHRLANPLFFCKATRWRAPQSTTLAQCSMARCWKKGARTWPLFSQYVTIYTFTTENWRYK
jgi:hypothetical protein